MEAAVDSSRVKASGQTLWSHVKHQLLDEILQGPLKPGDRLPAESELVERFSVSRHTVRRAMAELVDLGLVRVEQGRGAFVHGSVVHYRLSNKVTHSENLMRQGRSPNSRFLAVEETVASPEIADGLAIAVGEPVYAINSLSYADQVPIATGWNYIPKERFPDLPLRKRKWASMSAIYAKHGIADYLRLKTVVTAQPPTDLEARLLQQPTSRWVLVTKKVDGDLDRVPICYGDARWVADRVQFTIDVDAF